MKLSVGDKIYGQQHHNKGIIREIVDVRDTGYTWKYPDHDDTYWSENSNDPFFEFGWELLK